MGKKWKREMRQRNNPKEPGRRKSQKPDKIGKKEEAQIKKQALEVDKCEQVGHFRVKLNHYVYMKAVISISSHTSTALETEMFGPYSVSICSPLPRAAGLLAEGKFVPVLQVQRHQQSCSQSTLLRRKTVTKKIEEVQENVKKRARVTY
ncbi:hypothetical protein TURU_164253 [Turdus rufiventris]|nr:hypothetical protein TURU_164253 [Turdus rufiventris]